MSTVRIQKRKNAKKIIKDISLNSNNYLIIHYSCESFYNIKDGRTPRITSISVRYFNKKQTKSFSIFKIAEIEKKIDNIDENYDYLEKKMLDEFFKFLKKHKDFYWIHWNMRDENYGFGAIENRYKVLGGKPTELEDDRKVDLALLLIDIYGPHYISNPRLPELIKKNDISKKDFLKGEDEAKCFEEKNFLKLHQSTLRKVDIFQTIIDRVENNTLLTNSQYADIYGYKITEIYEYINENLLAKSLFWILLTIASSIISIFIGTLLSK